MVDRPTLLVLADFYLPGFRAGGPIRSIENLVNSLAGEFEFKVVTRDRDLHSDRPYPTAGTGWQPVGNASVRYLDPRESRFRLRGVLGSTPHDILYLNSFFSARFSILPLLLRRLHAIPHRPLVIAPRGEFSPGALRLKSWKKRAWLRAASMMGLGRDAWWQASSQREAAQIGAAIGVGGRIVVAPDITGAPSPSDDTPHARSARKRVGSARLVFLSRISPKKNLEYALAMLLKDIDGHVEFDIYGPVDDRVYWAKCNDLMASVNRPTVRVTYRGEIPHAQVRSVLSRYDLFVLPTLDENFGHVIYEALAAGCPVAISDQTPWGDVVDAGAGWVTPLSDDRGWVRAVAHVVDSNEDAHSRLRVAARRLAEQHGHRSRDIALNRELFVRSLA